MKTCLACDKPFESRRGPVGWTETCSQHCNNVNRLREAGVEVKVDPNKAGNAARMARKHAAKRAAFVEKVDPEVVFERDNGVCYICHEPVDGTLSGRDRMGPTVDHVIPFSQGGLDCYDNVALAHRSCNSRKWVQLAAVGSAP